MRSTRQACARQRTRRCAQIRAARADDAGRTVFFGQEIKPIACALLHSVRQRVPAIRPRSQHRMQWRPAA